MKLNDIKTIGIVGAGTMGSGIALSYALGGYSVILNARTDESISKGLERIKAGLKTYIDGGLISEEEFEEILQRITTTTDFSYLQKADFICENALDSKDIKSEIFRKLDKLCPPHTILATNTSTLKLSEFTSHVKRQDKLVVTHYFNPAYIIPAVEVVKGPHTSEETFSLTYELLIKAKKMPVKVLKEIPGHLVNRVQFAMWRELYYLYCLGVASIEDIDRVCQGSFGIRLATIGPLLTDDMAGSPKWGQIGIDMCNAAFSSISSEKQVPQKVQELLLSGKGFYNINDEQLSELAKKRDMDLLQQLGYTYPQLLP